MQAVLSVASEGGGPPVGTGLVIAAVFALIIALAMTLKVRERRQFSQLLEYAASQDWHPVTDPAGLLPLIADALLSKRSKLFRRFRTMPLWISWHQWTEISRGSTYNPSTQRWESRTSYVTHDLTRYFMMLPGTYPDMTVERRTKMGGLVKPRRGLGTGDDEFDRRFLVKPPDDPGTVGHITQRLAQALLSQAVPPFGISGNVLIVRYDDRPTRANLEYRADQVKRLTLLLTPSRQNRG
jgi:hypothetical protein